jgi:hypothetical protein
MFAGDGDIGRAHDVRRHDRRAYGRGARVAAAGGATRQNGGALAQLNHWASSLLKRHSNR